MKKIFTGLMLAAALSAPAYAAEPGGYIDMDIGGANYTGANFGGVNGNLTFPNPGTFQIGGGYRVNHNLAVEGGLVGMGDSTVYDFLGNSETLRTGAIYGAAVGLLPLGPQFDLFGKVGIASITMDDIINGGLWARASQTNLIWGIGGQININRNWGVRLQYMNFGNVDFPPGTIFVNRGVSVGVNTYTIGGIYTF